jgi:hypothetical protein
MQSHIQREPLAAFVNLMAELHMIFILTHCVHENNDVACLVLHGSSQNDSEFIKQKMLRYSMRFVC